MKPQSLRRSTLLGMAALLSLVAACRFNYGFKVEVKAGTSRDEKVALAQAVVLEERLTSLRMELRKRFPNLTEKQAAGIGFGIQVWNSPKKDGTARVYIAIQARHGQGFDPQPVVLAAGEILEANLDLAGSTQPSL